MTEAAHALTHPTSGDAPDALLKVTGLTKGFGGASVIEGLDLTLRAGEVLGIIGPNGAGKTTFFNLLAGVLSPSAGSITYRGQDISQLRTWDRCRLGIGRTYQIPKPFAHMSVFENVLVPAVHGGGVTIAQARARAEAALELAGLADAYALPAGALPLLDLKRLELCRAIALNPHLLLLDEIAGGLTDAESDALLSIIATVNAQGATIIWIEHVLHALQRLSTRLAVLYGGRFLADGEPAAVLADPQVRAIYLGTEP